MMKLATMASQAGLRLNVASLGLLSQLKDLKTADITSDLVLSVCDAFSFTPSRQVVDEITDMIRNEPSTSLPTYLSREDVFFPLMEKLTSSPSACAGTFDMSETDDVPVSCTCCNTEGVVSRRRAAMSGRFVNYRCNVCGATRDILSDSVINYGS